MFRITVYVKKQLPPNPTKHTFASLFTTYKNKLLIQNFGEKKKFAPPSPPPHLHYTPVHYHSASFYVYVPEFFLQQSVWESISITYFTPPSILHHSPFTYTYKYTHMKIQSMVQHLQTQRSIASTGPGAKSILFDRESKIDGAEWRRCGYSWTPHTLY